MEADPLAELSDDGDGPRRRAEPGAGWRVCRRTREEGGGKPRGARTRPGPHACVPCSARGRSWRGARACRKRVWCGVANSSPRAFMCRCSGTCSGALLNVFPATTPPAARQPAHHLSLERRAAAVLGCQQVAAALAAPRRRAVVRLAWLVWERGEPRAACARACLGVVRSRYQLSAGGCQPITGSNTLNWQFLAIYYCIIHVCHVSGGRSTSWTSARRRWWSGCCGRRARSASACT